MHVAAFVDSNLSCNRDSYVYFYRSLCLFKPCVSAWLLIVALYVLNLDVAEVQRTEREVLQGDVVESVRAFYFLNRYC